MSRTTLSPCGGARKWVTWEVLCYLPKSPLMQLVALDAGLTTISEIFIKYGEEFAKPLKWCGARTMRRRRSQWEFLPKFL